MGKYLVNKLNKQLVGKTIKSVEYMTDEESKYHDFSKAPIVVKFEDGTCFIPLKDDECNDGGAMYCGLKSEGITIPCKMVK